MNPNLEEAARIIEALIQRLESHEEGACCYLDARDRTAIKRAKDFLTTVR